MTIQLYKVIGEQSTVIDTFVSEGQAIYHCRRHPQARAVVNSAIGEVYVKPVHESCFVAIYETLTGARMSRRIPLTYGMSHEDMMAKAARYTPRVNYMLVGVR